MGKLVVMNWGLELGPTPLDLERITRSDSQLPLLLLLSNLGP